MNPPLIEVLQLSKKYSRPRRSSPLRALGDILFPGRPAGRRGGHLREGEFWALKDLNLEVRRGECYGVIGPNGTGKTTLLKLLAGVLRPDEGRVLIRGAVSPVVGHGMGFHPLLTAEENIRVVGSLGGHPQKAVNRSVDAILEYAGLEEYRGIPLGQYSGGMRLRLGFAAAVHFRPDALLIDEALAVGDEGFQIKCLNTLFERSPETAMFMVSHAMHWVSRVCNRILVLGAGGRALYAGSDVRRGIEIYREQCGGPPELVAGSGEARIDEAVFESGGRRGIQTIRYAEEFAVHLKLCVDPGVKKPLVRFAFKNEAGVDFAMCDSGMNRVCLENPEAPFEVSIRFSSLPFNPDRYFLSAAVFDEAGEKTLTYRQNFKSFTVTGETSSYPIVQMEGEWSIRTLREECGASAA